MVRLSIGHNRTVGAIRAFVAIYPSDEERRRLETFRDALRARWPEGRWVRGQQLHLTLKFLGALQEERVEEFRRAMREQAARTAPFDLCLVHRAPPWPGAHVVALVAESDRLDSLARKIEALARSMGVPAEERPFRGHVTLARAEGRLPAALLAQAFEDRWIARSCRLVRSELGPSGAKHTLLEEFPFAG